MEKCVLFMFVSFNRMSNRIDAQDVNGHTRRTCDMGQYTAANTMTSASLLWQARLAEASLGLSYLRCDIVMNSPQWILLDRQ